MSNQPDWEAIKREYRLNLRPLRPIAADHGVSEAAIRKRAKKHGWSRDLSEDVASVTKAKLTRTTASSRRCAEYASGAQATPNDGTQAAIDPYEHTSGANDLTDDEVVEQVSNHAVEVVLSHRVQLAKWKKIVGRVQEALEDATVTQETAGDISRTANAGVDALIKIIKAERQAYNLDDAPLSEETYEQKLVRLFNEGKPQ